MIAGPTLPPAIVVRGLADARTALGPGRPVTLLSARGAAMFAGVLFWQALMDAAGLHERPDCVDVLDCADGSGRALEGLRLNQRLLILEPGSVGAADIAERAVRQGSLVLTRRPAALDLAERGAQRRLAAWLDPGRPQP
jgi:hypothetical protein